jgi:hypothetical protein
MQGIYAYMSIPETNHVPKEYNFEAIMSLLFMAHKSLASALALMYFYFNNNNNNNNIIIIIIIIICGTAAQRGLWPPRSRGSLTTHNDAPQSVGLLWTNDQPVTETST